MSSRYEPGSLLFTQKMPPVTRAMLALYAGGSNDHTPVHYDIDEARAVGFDDVFAQGMFVMALMSRCLSDHVPPERVRAFSARFVSRTQLGAELRCQAVIEELCPDGWARLQLTFTDQDGDVKLRGAAEIAADS